MAQGDGAPMVRDTLAVPPPTEHRHDPAEHDAGNPGLAGADLADRHAVAAARTLLAEARRVLVLTGAGISTASGIPDFRGPQGLWTRDPAAERQSSIDAYISDPGLRRQIWRSRLHPTVPQPRPNAGHRTLLALERRRQLALLVTQNVDGLHLDAGHDPALVVEIHGTNRAAVCLRCGARWPMVVVLDRVRGGDEDPHCQERAADGSTCGGLVKAATISFGQPLVVADLRRAEAAARTCDLLLAVGTTLAVYPAAGLVPLAAEHGARVVIVNADATELDHLADVIVRGDINDVLPQIVEDHPAA